MPIRIRNSDKSIIALPSKAIFVELVNNDGEVMGVISEDKLHNSMSFFDGEATDKVLRYSKFYNVKFVDKAYHLALDKSKLNVK